MFRPISFSGKLFRYYLLAPRHPAKIRIQNLLIKYFFTTGILLKNESGIILKLQPNDWITRIILIHGGYETASLSLAKNILKDGGLFIDVGANFGLYSCIISQNNGVNVFAVEPNFMVMPDLLENIRLNKRENISVLNTALSGEFQFASMDMQRENNLGTASFKVQEKAAFSILSCSLNYIFKSQFIENATLIKIDIEGNEFAVLKDFSFEIYPVKNILLEFNNLSDQSFQDLENFFQQKGFVIRDINGQKLNSDISHIPENNLWLENINYIKG